MDIMKYILMGFEILINPVENLKKYKNENLNILDLIIYLAIFNITSFIGLFFGHIFFWSAQLSGTIVLTLFLYLAAIFAVIVAGIVLNYIAPMFKIKQNQLQIMKLFAFAITPVLLVGITNIYPIRLMFILTFIAIIYGLFIFYKGMEIILEVPKENQIIFLIITAILIVVGLGIYFGMWIGFENSIYGMLWPYYYEPMDLIYR